MYSINFEYTVAMYHNTSHTCQIVLSSMRKLKLRVKHLVKLHVWGGRCPMFTSIMNVDIFLKQVYYLLLQKIHWLPWAPPLSWQWPKTCYDHREFFLKEWNYNPQILTRVRSPIEHQNLQMQCKFINISSGVLYNAEEHQSLEIGIVNEVNNNNS